MWFLKTIESDQVMYLFFDSLQREHEEFLLFFWGAKYDMSESVYEMIYTNNELQMNLFIEVNWSH